MLFNQKSPVHEVPGPIGGDRQETDKKHMDIATYRLNWPMCRFSEKVTHYIHQFYC